MDRRGAISDRARHCAVGGTHARATTSRRDSRRRTACRRTARRVSTPAVAARGRDAEEGEIVVRRRPIGSAVRPPPARHQRAGLAGTRTLGDPPWVEADDRPRHDRAPIPRRELEQRVRLARLRERRRGDVRLAVGGAAHRCRRLPPQRRSAQGMWTVSFNGTAQEAAALVAFFNGSVDDDHGDRHRPPRSRLADRRRLGAAARRPRQSRSGAHPVLGGRQRGLRRHSRRRRATAPTSGGRTSGRVTATTT